MSRDGIPIATSMTDEIDSRSLQDAIERLYASSFADFIRVRDALAKELRSAGKRDAALMVKGLRKPSRAAWALNRVAHVQPDTLVALAKAVAEIVDAHAGAGDLRAAMVTLRTAVRDVATHAAEASRSAGFSLDIGDLTNGIHAVLGHPSSYDELRTGRLTDVPEAGGLDFLTSLPARPRLEVSSSATQSSPPLDPAEDAAAQEQARLASEALQAARSAAEAAAAALAEADSDVSVAQERLRAAESELKAALQRREFASRTKDAASIELRNAEAVSHAADQRPGNG